MSKTDIKYTNLGLKDYKKAWDFKENLFQQKLKNKIAEKQVSNDVFFCEHNHVYTLGKSGVENNLLINDDFLKKINATYYKTYRKLFTLNLV